MIPSLAMVRVGGHRHRGIRLWLPLFLLWPFLLPVAVIFVVAGLVVAPSFGVAAAPRMVWRLASGLRGLHIEIDSPEVALQIRFI
jgi:hypothetical protein